MSGKVLAISNQKGGVGKSTTAASLGFGLARQGKRVLLIDNDPQGSLTASLGYQQPDKLPVTLETIMRKIIEDKQFSTGEGILQHDEGVDLLPANIELSGLELLLVNTMSRETILREYINTVRNIYDYIIIDCMPSLGMLTINALAAADSVIIPVQAQFLSIKGLEQLLRTIFKVRKQINPGLMIDGILLTMVDNRTNYAREISQILREQYGNQLRIFENEIPRSVRAEETSAEGKSIYKYDPRGKVAAAYSAFVREVS